MTSVVFKQPQLLISLRKYLRGDNQHHNHGLQSNASLTMPLLWTGPTPTRQHRQLGELRYGRISTGEHENTLEHRGKCDATTFQINKKANDSNEQTVQAAMTSTRSAPPACVSSSSCSSSNESHRLRTFAHDDIASESI